MAQLIIWLLKYY